MSKKHKQPAKSKKQLLREERQRKQRRNRLLFIAGISAVALLFIGLVVLPFIQTSRDEVGEFNEIESQVWETADGISIGNPQSPVFVEVFEDFKCSACRKYTETIEPVLIENYALPGEIHYTVYNYPFMDDNNPVKDSDRAAVASMCAAEQNRFWDYHIILYRNLNFVENEFNLKRLAAFAESLGLDMDAFNTCLDENNVQEQIDEHILKGQQYQLTGTPSIFVNGVNIKPGYVPSYEELKAAIEAAKAGLNG